MFTRKDEPRKKWLLPAGCTDLLKAFCIFFFLGKQLTWFVLLYRVKMHPLDKFTFKLSGLMRFRDHIFPVLRVKSD